MSKTICAVLITILLVGCQAAPPVSSPSPKATVSTSPEFAQEGRRLFERTYEKLPDVKSKLHCASCHLDGGTIEGALPLLNLGETYSHDEALVRQVNTCLQVNLNAPELPEDSKEMEAFLSYLRSLKMDPEMPRGLKQLDPPEQQPDADNGQALFEAQCAPCHQADGNGSYPDGKYQYPPLWGERSFTTGSGLANEANFAGFVHAKMPLGRGRTLTQQEVWDIAAYVMEQPRPEPSKP